MKPHPFHLASALFLTWAGSIVAAPLANALPPELANPSVEAVESHPRQGLPNFFAKLKQGKDVRIAYFGGSITAQDQQFSFWLVWEVWCPPFRVSDATWDHPPFVPFVPFVPK